VASGRRAWSGRGYELALASAWGDDSWARPLRHEATPHATSPALRAWEEKPVLPPTLAAL
jgi:hypothetical protein